MPNLIVGMYETGGHLWVPATGKFVRRTRWQLHARLRHKEQHRRQGFPGLVRKPIFRDRSVQGRSMHACLFGNSFERHLATFPPAICRVKSQTPKFMDYFGRCQGRLLVLHWVRSGIPAEFWGKRSHPIDHGRNQHLRCEFRQLIDFATLRTK